MTGVKNAILSTMGASPTLIVHQAMNEYVVERDGIGGSVHIVHYPNQGDDADPPLARPLIKRSAKASVIGAINEHQFIDLYVVHLQIDR